MYDCTSSEKNSDFLLAVIYRLWLKTSFSICMFVPEMNNLMRQNRFNTIWTYFDVAYISVLSYIYTKN